MRIGRLARRCLHDIAAHGSPSRGRRVAVYLGAVGPLLADEAAALQDQVRRRLGADGVHVETVLWDVDERVPLEDRPGLMRVLQMKADAQVDVVLTDVEHRLTPRRHSVRRPLTHWLNPR